MAVVLLFVMYSCTSRTPIFEVTVLKEIKEVISVETLNGDPVYLVTNVLGDTMRCLIPEGISKGNKPPYRAVVRKSTHDKYAHVIRLKLK